jgi:hypothetical protein
MFALVTQVIACRRRWAMFLKLAVAAGLVPALEVGLELRKQPLDGVVVRQDLRGILRARWRIG